jgi:hypothetical protein
VVLLVGSLVEQVIVVCLGYCPLLISSTYMTIQSRELVYHGSRLLTSHEPRPGNVRIEAVSGIRVW